MCMGMWCARFWRKRAWGVLAGAFGARALGSCCLILLFLPRFTVHGADLPVQDIFGRDITERGITLVDWEGYLANPLIRFYVFPPTNAVLPATATLIANGPRLYFETASAVSSQGPSKIIYFTAKDAAISVNLSIFPDRDGIDEDYLLTIAYADGAGRKLTNTLPIHVIDQDRERTNEFAVTVNYDRDATGFFTNPVARIVVQSAVDDWAYFFAAMNLDAVKRGTETTYIWANNFNGGYTFTNTNDYRGYLLYAYGTTNAAHRSGGEGSFSGGVQRRGGVELGIKRSGGFEAEIYGNYNTLGWLYLTNDDQWLATGNLGNETNDFYSIAHHEVGHALMFNPAHPGFSAAKSAGAFTNATVQAYYGKPASIDGSDHLNGAIDPESGQGAFGYDYYGRIPRKRWLITKLDLLAAQAVGYELRATSPFQALAFATNSPAGGAVNVPYSAALEVSGGIPVYFWEVVGGALPPGLKLDSFNGTISGTPTTSGDFPFSVRVRDYHENGPGMVRDFNLRVSEIGRSHLRLTVAGSELRIDVESAEAQAAIVEASADLINWRLIATNPMPALLFEVVEHPATLPSRFYRAFVP